MNCSKKHIKSQWKQFFHFQFFEWLTPAISAKPRIWRVSAIARRAGNCSWYILTSPLYMKVTRAQRFAYSMPGSTITGWWSALKSYQNKFIYWFYKKFFRFSPNTLDGFCWVQRSKSYTGMLFFTDLFIFFFRILIGGGGGNNCIPWTTLWSSSCKLIV